MKSMTGMSAPTKASTADNERGLADDINTFFTRQESLDNSYRCTEILKGVTPAPSDRIIITEEDVRKVFQGTNTKKGSGPDECSAFLLKKLYLSWFRCGNQYPKPLQTHTQSPCLGKPHT